MRARRLTLALTVAAASVLSTGGPARADLREDARRLAAAWKSNGQRVTALAPVFVEHGRPKLVVVEPNGPGGPVSPSGKGCTTVAFLGVRTADFFVEPDRPFAVPPVAEGRGEGRGEGREPDERRARSAAGAGVLSRCGNEQADLHRIGIDVVSSRAALEIIVAQGDEPAPDVDESLEERAQGPLAPRGDVGGAIEPGALGPRVAQAMARATAVGAARVTRQAMRAAATGTGVFQTKLAGGCHRLDLMAEIPSRFPRRATDLDAEARDADTGRVLARDRADVPDARLDVCVGDATRVEVSFLGAAEAVEVVMTDAHFALPVHIPGVFGKRARGGFAFALHRRRAPAPAEPPIHSTLGVQGITDLAIEVEPGKCYLAAVALMKGDARALRLAALLEGRAARDESLDRVEGAAVAFCSTTGRHARLEVDARGNSPWWALVVWPMGTTAP